MDILPLDVLSILTANLDDRAFKALILGNKLMQKIATEIKKDALFWKEKVENFLEIYLPDVYTDRWESIYNTLISKKNLNKLLYTDDVLLIDILLRSGKVDPTANDNEAIREASADGHVEVVKLLLADKRVDPAACNNKAIQWASEYGCFDVVELLLSDKRVDPAAKNNYAMRVACGEGHVKVVKLLLADVRVDPAAKNNKAIRWASEHGCFEVAELLLSDSRVDPTAEDNYAIRQARKNGHTRIVDIIEEYLKKKEQANKNLTPYRDDLNNLIQQQLNLQSEMQKLQNQIAELTAKINK